MKPDKDPFFELPEFEVPQKEPPAASRSSYEESIRAFEEIITSLRLREQPRRQKESVPLFEL